MIRAVITDISHELEPYKVALDSTKLFKQPDGTYRVDGGVAAAHAASHAAAGSDPVTVEESQVTGLVGDLTSLDGRLDTAEATLAAATPVATPSTLALRDADGGAAFGYVEVDPTPTVVQTGAPGRMVWNDEDGTIEFQLKGGNVTLQVGQEQVMRVRNSEVTPLVEGEVVYVTGSTGTHNTVLRATNTTEAASDRAIAVVTEPIGAHPGEGFVTTGGFVRGINTNHLTEGALVYLGVGGATTAVEPVAPNHTVVVGYCVKKSGGAGVLFVHVTAYPELSELHDVKLTAPANGDSLSYDSGLGYWKNIAASAAAWLLKAGDTMTGPLGLAASVAGAVGTAALKIPSGPLLLAPEAGAIERLVDKLYFTISTGLSRKQVVLADSGLTSGRIPFATTDGRLLDNAKLLWDNTFNFFSVGTTYKFVTLGDQAANGDLPANHALMGSTLGSLCFFAATTTGGAAYKVICGYYNGSAIKSAWEINNTTGGTAGHLKLMTGGGYTSVGGDMVVPKTSGVGIRVDPAVPTFGWRDLTCAIDPKGTGLGTPTRTIYRGTIYGYAFGVGDLADFDGFHIPHDYVPGSNIYVHVHWSHNGTAIVGTAAFGVTMAYAKGHNQANFPAEVTQTITVATPDIATVPQYRHRVDEVQASQAGGSATLHNTTDIEVDGLMIGYIKLITLPTITGGDLFIHTVDIHYQSTNMATKQKSPSFYV